MPEDPPDVLAPGVRSVLARMDRLVEPMHRRGDHLRFFLDTYRRTTLAVGQRIEDAGFEDPTWVDAWDVAFAELYLQALAAYQADPSSAPRPWRAAFGAEPGLHPLQHVLLGINAHVNYDLPQALLAVISVADFERPLVMARRRRDHERIDHVLASRVAAEDAELAAAQAPLPVSVSGRPRSARARRPVDRLLQPVNRLASRRFLAEARQKVWTNAQALHVARVNGPQAYRRRLAELELLSAARVADLLAPGSVLLKLGLGGFGVVLPPP